MLENIHVKNIALIKEIDINLKKGLNIVTGETGAGKSLIIGSIGIGLGSKVTKDFITQGESEALIELTFTDINGEVKKILEDNDIPIEDSIIIQRRITPKRTVNRINFTTVSISLLKEVGTKLIQIHGQNDNQLLLNKSSHIRVVDDFAGKEISELKKDYQKVYNDLLRISQELKEIEELGIKRARDYDYYTFAIDEIEKAQLIIGEDEELREKYDYMVDIQNCHEDLIFANEHMQEGVINNLEKVILTFNEITKKNKEARKILESLHDINSLAKDTLYDINSLLNDVDFDEEQFEVMDQRLDKISALKKKYGGNIQAVLKYLEDIKEKVSKIEKADELKLSLKKDGKVLKERALDLANKIHDLRKEKATELEKKIVSNLEELNFNQVDFKIIFEKKQRLSNDGQDDVEMFISTNVGYPLKPLSETASGGELARIMLAIESIISSTQTVDSMVFDEVDVGISGKTGTMVAKRLREMSSSNQIICITHLPQIAGAGDVHYKIDKVVKDNMTTTSLKELNQDESIQEVARLLGGVIITDATIQNAKELVASLKKE